MVELLQSYNGFKSIGSKLAKNAEESGDLIEFDFELDDEVLDFQYSELPAYEVLKNRTRNSNFVYGGIYVNGKKKHRILLKEPNLQNDKKNQEDPALENSLNSFLSQFQIIQKANSEITKERIEMMSSHFAQQLEGVKKLYSERDSKFLELNKMELDIKIKEVELNSRKKTEVWESVVKGLGEGLKEGLGWIKENPAHLADVLDIIKSKKVKQ